MVIVILPFPQYASICNTPPPTMDSNNLYRIFGTIEWGWDTAGYREDRMGFCMGIWGYTMIYWDRHSFEYETQYEPPE